MAKKKEDEYTEKWRKKNTIKKANIEFNTGKKKSEPSTLLGKVQKHNDDLKKSDAEKKRAQGTINKAKSNYQRNEDIRPKLTTVKNSLEQARQVNAQVAAAMPKVVSGKALKSGSAQGKTNLVQGTKQGLLALADSPFWKAAANAEASKLLPYQNSKSPSLQRAVKFNNQIAGNYSLEQQRRNLAQQTLQQQQAIANKYGPLNQGEQIVSDVVANMIPMLPSIGAGMMTGGIGAAAGLGARGIQLANTAGSMGSMFNYARGLGETQALNEGATMQQANNYGLATGALETGTEMLIGGIPGLPSVGRILRPGQARALTAGIQNQTLKRAADAAIDIGGEGLEEVIAEVADPYIQRKIYNPDAQNATAQDIAHAAIMGMLTGGLMKGGAHLAGKAMEVPPRLTRASETMRQAQQTASDNALFGSTLEERNAQQERAMQINAENARKAAELAQRAQEAAEAARRLPVIIPSQQAQNAPENRNNEVGFYRTGEIDLNLQGKSQKTIHSLPMEQRTFENVGDKKVKAYQQENPAVRPFYQETASNLLADLQQGTKGGRDVGINPETRNVTTRSGWQRQQSEPINRMLDDGMSYPQIEDGLQRIIEDHGKENTASAKRAELYVHDATVNGYRNVQGEQVQPNGEFAYRGQTLEQLQELNTRLDNAYTGDPVKDAAIIRNQEIVQNLMRKTPPTPVPDIRPRLKRPEPVQQPEQINTSQSEQPIQQDNIANYANYDLTKLQPEVRSFLEQVGSKSGFDVAVFDGLPKGANGMYQNGVVYLDGNKVNSLETARKIAAHEVYHGLRGTEEFMDLQDIALEYLLSGNQNMSRQQLVQSKMEQYSKLDVEIDIETAYDELTAEFMEQALSDPKVAERIWQERPSLAQRIFEFIQNLMQRFTGHAMSAPEQQQRALLQRAADMYAKGLQSMQYNGLQQQDSQPRQMFAGEKSQTADLDALARAKQMAASGADMESIQQETGWFRSKVTGGKWAYEIDDSKAEYRASGDGRLLANPKYRRKQELEQRYLYSMLGEAEPLTDAEQTELERLQEIFSAERTGKHLDDYLYHPELYKAYPDLSYTKYAEDELNNGLSGYHSAAEERIVIDPRFHAKDTILHETQHAVQSMEGFPRGASPGYWKMIAQSKEDYVNESMLRMRQRKFIKQINELSASSGLDDYFDQLLDKEMNGEITSEQVEVLEQEFIEQNVPELKALKDELYNDIYIKLQEIGSRKPDADKLYYNTAGEIMARDTARRSNWDEANRRKITPAMDSEQGIVYSEGYNMYADQLDQERRALLQSFPDELRNKIREMNRATLDKDFDRVNDLEAELLEGPYADLYEQYDRLDFAYRGAVEDNGQPLNGSSRYSGNGDIRYSLSDMADQYGAIPVGENPLGTNRDVQVPKQTSDFDKVRKGTRTGMEAEQVADETVAGIQKELDSDVQSGMFTYEPTSNKADLAEANKRIAANGWEETGRQLHEVVLSGRRINSADMATLERLIQEAQRAGQYDKAVEFVSDLAVIGTESGQNIQAIRMLKRLTPEGQLMTLKNAQRRINNSLISKGQPAVPGISSEIAQEFLQVRGNKKRGEIWDKEIARMAQQTEGSWVDKLNAIRYAAMLSNPRTHFRNFIGNCAMQAARYPTNLISAALEDVASFSQKRRNPNGMEQNRSLRNKTGQSSKELRKYAEMVWTADGEAAMRNVGNRYDDVSGQFAQNQRVFGHTVAGNVLEALAGKGKYSVGSVLDAEDLWFKHATYVNTLVAYMKANGITTRDAALNVVKPNGASIGKGMEYAGLQARKATFTEDNKLANRISKLENTNLGTQLALGAIIPFKKTPMNIITRGVEYSPVGLLMTGYKLQDAARHQKTVKEYDELENRYSKKKVSRESKYTVNDVLESLAANLTGTGLLAAGIFLASQGMLAATGDDDDKRKERYEQQMGDQNFAVVLDDGSTYTIDWLAPAAMPLLTGVEVYNQLFSGKYDETDDALVSRALSAAGKIADPVFEMSCMQGVASALASYSGDTGDIASTLAANIGTGYAGQFIPAPVGALARTIDDTVRSSYAPKDSPYTKTGESFLRQQRSKLPGLSTQNQPSIDVWGNDRKREFAGSDPSDVAMRIVMNFISPGNYSSNKRTELDNSLEKLYKATGDSNVLPKRADTYIKRDGKPTVYLSPYEYSRFSTTKGKKSAQYAGDFTSSDAYKNLDDTTKADIVSKLYELANYEAKKEALEKRNIDYSDTKYENALKSGVKPYEYYVTKERFDGKFTDYKDAKKHAEYADKMGMKDGKYAAIYDGLRELKADETKQGKTVKDSRQKKVVAYLNNELRRGNITKEQWYYFYTKEYPSQAKNAPYAWIREANKR